VEYPLYEVILKDRSRHVTLVYRHRRRRHLFLYNAIQQLIANNVTALQ